MTEQPNPQSNPPESAKRGFWQKLIDSLRKDNVDGDAHVSAAAIIITAVFLMALTAALLYGITAGWPVCGELPLKENVNNNAAGDNTNRSATPPANGNASGATGANTNGNSNASANVTANANTANTNTGANNNTGATAASSPTNGNVGEGTTPDETQPTGEGETAAKPDADTIEPKTGPITGKTLVTIKGKNFGTSVDDIKVRFDEKEAKVSQVSDESITARTPEHSEGAVDVSVERGKDKKNRDVLPAGYTYTCPSPTGTNLFYMIILAGALGGCIHALRSLAWYVGQRELKWSWLPRYYTLPFVGAAMAMLFGLLIFAGLFDNTTGRSESLFIIAVAGLVGMFSQQAALKLTDIANAIFTKPEPGKDAEPQKGLAVDSGDETPAGATDADIDLKSGSIAGGPPAVKITNTGLSDVVSVTFGGQPATDVSFDTATSTVTATPPSAAAAGDVDIEVKDAAGKTVKLKYTYTAP